MDTTSRSAELQRLIQKYAPTEMDEDSRSYIASVLEDQEDDIEAVIATCFQGQAAIDLAREVRDLQSRESQGVDNLTCSPAMALISSTNGECTDDETNSDESNTLSPKAKARRSRVEARRHARMEKKKGKTRQKENDFVDDDVSAWNERLSEGKAWGGRGYGGRGVRGDVNTASNIHLPNVTLQFAGNELLQSSTIQINGGHRYGLVGRNGCGKSTLLQRLAAHAIPGMPHDLRIVLVKQQIEGGDETALQSLMSADRDRIALLEEQAKLERKIESTNDLDELVTRLAAIASELDMIDAEGAEERARDILTGLQFSEGMMLSPTKSLSGGWRMRLALAQALYLPSDLLLLDEPTNHLDLHALDWLSTYVQNSSHTIILVSHDRAFLDICTDIITFDHKRLKYYPGNYSDYTRSQQEKTARQAQILDASERQKSKAMEFVRKQEAAANKKNADPNKQRQAKMIKDKKLDRIGNFREDGKKYKNFSLSELSESAVRLAEKVVIEVDEPVIRMQFPDPTWSYGATPGSSLIRLENLRFGYVSKAAPLLTGLTLNIERGSKISVVGRNGAGKSTLLKLLTGEIDPMASTYSFKGEIWRHPTLRIGHVTQYSVENLQQFADMTTVEYAENFLDTGKASSKIIKNASGNVRQYLGRFGLGGTHSHRVIRSLSGGERMRLCFATVLAEEPHLLVLDEPTNHLDIETLDALSSALRQYQGAVVIVSHNQEFLSGFCRELWVVENGGVDVRHQDGGSFDALFSAYRKGASADLEGRRNKRQQKTALAKMATQLRTGAKQGTGFIP